MCPEVDCLALDTPPMVVFNVLSDGLAGHTFVLVSFNVPSRGEGLTREDHGQ